MFPRRTNRQQFRVLWSFGFAATTMARDGVSFYHLRWGTGGEGASPGFRFIDAFKVRRLCYTSPEQRVAMLQWSYGWCFQKSLKAKAADGLPSSRRLPVGTGDVFENIWPAARRRRRRQDQASKQGKPSPSPSTASATHARNKCPWRSK